MNIKKMVEKDSERVFSLMREFYNSNAVIEKAKDEVLRQDIFDCVGDNPYIDGLVFTEDEEIIGYSMIAKSYSTEYGGICLWIEDLYLIESARRKGYATIFFKYLENLYSGKIVRMRLEAEKTNFGALNVYKKNGFIPLQYIQLHKTTDLQK